MSAFDLTDLTNDTDTERTKSAFDLTDIDTPTTTTAPKSKPKTKTAQQTQEDIYRRISDLPPGQIKLEAHLETVCWFPYRRINHVERTRQFVIAYDRVYLSLIDKNPDVSPKYRAFMRHRGSYLKRDEIIAPWISNTKKGISLNSKWSAWVKARREADERMMIYDDYVAGALLSSMLRGWRGWPLPSMLTSDKLLGKLETDGYTDATIPAFEKRKYEKRIKRTEDPWFLASAYEGHPVQVAYCRHFAHELLRIKGHENAAERAFKLYQRDGVIHDSLVFRDLIQS
ncbi:MAG: hypothetical protein LPL29_14460 [Alphaproteobacteria bacterium]|nr:hypothetical protein [Alphaproteobacteria bacterium]